MNNPDHIIKSLESIFWVKILKFFDADPGSWGKNSDPGSGMEKNLNPGSGINIPDTQHWFNSLFLENNCFLAYKFNIFEGGGASIKKSSVCKGTHSEKVFFVPMKYFVLQMW